MPNLPPKPRPVIIERWLPYHKQKRQIVHEKAKPLEPMTRIKNTIIEWRPPEVEVVKHVKKLGVQEADPQRYYTQYGDKLYATEFVHRKLTELGLQEELALMQEQQNSAAKEDIALEQADDYNVRQILNGSDLTSLRTQKSSSLSLSHIKGTVNLLDRLTRRRRAAVAQWCVSFVRRRNQVAWMNTANNRCSTNVRRTIREVSSTIAMLTRWTRMPREPVFSPKRCS